MAESAARAGHDVTSLDAFGDLDRHPGVRALAMARDFDAQFSASAVATAAKSIGCDAIAYLSPFENHPRAVARLAGHSQLLGNDAATLTRARDPLVLRPALRAFDDSERWLLKPKASGGGHGIQWWSRGDDVPRGFHVQPFIDGAVGSIVFVAARDEIAPLGLTRQLVGDAAFGASGFKYCGSILAAAADLCLDDHVTERAIATAASLSRKLGLVGVNCVDFVVHDGTPVAIEVNPRYSASMELVEREYDVSVFATHAEACLGGELLAFDLVRARRERACAGKAIVFARHDVVCGDTTAWLGDSTVRDVPHPNERIPAGRPVCTVFANAQTPTECYANLVRRANAVYETLDAWAGVPA